MIVFIAWIASGIHDFDVEPCSYVWREGEPFQEPLGELHA